MAAGIERAPSVHTLNAAGLLLMHVAVAGVLVPVLAHVLPLPAIDPVAGGTSRP